MASYNQHDEDRDYRGRNQNPSNQNRDWNNRFDDQPRGQQRWQDDVSTRGVSGNDGYSRESSSASDERRNSWDQNRSRNNYTDHSRQSWENQNWRRDQDDASRRYSNDYGSSSRNQGYGSSYEQQDQNRRRSSDNDNDRSWSPSAQDRSRNMNSVYGRSSELNDRSRNQGYGSSYGQQAYTSGSDPNAYGRDQRRGSSSSDQNRYDQRSSSSNRNWQSGHNSWDSSRDNQGYGMRNDADYSRDFYDRDENSRYRQQRSHRDEDRHDDDDRGFFGRMADRVSHWFSDDDDDSRDNRRDWQGRDQRRSY